MVNNYYFKKVIVGLPSLHMLANKYKFSHAIISLKCLKVTKYAEDGVDDITLP
jgi:hypothetical protein